jgi:hypothetical protein
MLGFFLAVDEELLALQVILRLTDIHPVSRQFQLVELLVIRHGWKDFALYRSWSEWNPFQNVGIEQVHAGIDLIRHELSRFLHEALNHSLLVCHYYTVATWVFHFCDNQRAFTTMTLVEFDHFGEWVVTNNVSIKNEKQSLRVVSEQ